MTAKENVLKIYPDAYGVFWDDGEVFISNNTTDSHMRPFFKLTSWCKNEEEAWVKAWENIQKDIERKLSV